jgi:hypothetical protein
MSLAFDLHEHRVQVPLPLAGFHAFDPTFPDLRGKHQPEPMPPVSNRFVADIDAPFMKQIFPIAERQRKTDLQHHRKADDIGAGF